MWWVRCGISYLRRVNEADGKSWSVVRVEHRRRKRQLWERKGGRDRVWRVCGGGGGLASGALWVSGELLLWEGSEGREENSEISSNYVDRFLFFAVHFTCSAGRVIVGDTQCSVALGRGYLLISCTTPFELGGLLERCQIGYRIIDQ